jgi:hypothetical protein
MCDIE